MSPERISAAPAPSGAGLRLGDLRAANVARNAEWETGAPPTLSDRGLELGGEAGEAQNVIKKIARERRGARGSRATREDLARELADVVICADLVAMDEGIDLDEAIARKFNETSEANGLATRLSPRALPSVDAIRRIVLYGGQWIGVRAEEATAQAIRAFLALRLGYVLDEPLEGLSLRIATDTFLSVDGDWL